MSSRDEIFNLLHTTAGARGVSWSPDGEYLATASRSGSQILNVVTGEPVTHIDGQMYEAIWSPDGKYLATSKFAGAAFSEIHILKFSRGREIAYFNRKTKSQKWSPDSRYFIFSNCWL